MFTLHILFHMLLPPQWAQSLSALLLHYCEGKQGRRQTHGFKSRRVVNSVQECHPPVEHLIAQPEGGGEAVKGGFK